MSLNLGSAIAYLTLDTSGFESGFRRAESAMSGFSASGDTASSKLQSVGNTMTAIGGTLTQNVTMPILGLGAQIVSTGMDFEYAMSQVEKTVKGKGGLTEKEFTRQFNEMTDYARTLGKDTKFTAVEVATALEKMGMAGWDMGQMMSGIKPILDMAIAGNEDLTLTSDIVTDALTAFGLSADEAGHFCDVLAVASMYSNTNVGLLGDSFKYVAPVAGGFGFTVEDTALALGLMANSGLKASQSGTALRGVMANLANPVGQSAAAVDQLGIVLTHADGRTKSLKEIMDELRNKIGGIAAPSDELRDRIAALDEAFANGTITEAEYDEQLRALTESVYGKETADKIALAAMLAGKTGMAGLLAILTASQEDYDELTNAIAGATDEQTGYSAAAEMAAIAQENGRTDLDKLISSLADLAISLYELIEGPLREIINTIAEVVDWFNGLDDGVKKGIVKFLLFAAAVGPVLSLIGNLIKLGSTVVSVFNFFGGAIQTVIGFFGGSGSGLIGAIASVVQSISGGLIGIIGKVLGFIPTIISGIVSVGGSLVSGIGGAISAVVGVIGGVPLVVAGVIAAIIGVIVLLYNKWEWFHDLVDKVAGAIKDFFKGFFEGLGKVFSWLGETLGGAFESITEWGSNLWDKAKEIGSKFVDFIGEHFSKIKDKVGDWLSGAVDKVKEWGDDIKEHAGGAGEGFKEGLKVGLVGAPVYIASKLAECLTKTGKFKEDMGKEGEEASEKFKKGMESLDEIGSKIAKILGRGLAMVYGWKEDMIKEAKETSEEFVEKSEEGMKPLEPKTRSQFNIVKKIAEEHGVEMAEVSKNTGGKYTKEFEEELAKLKDKTKNELDKTEDVAEDFSEDLSEIGREAGEKHNDSLLSSMEGLDSGVQSEYDKAERATESFGDRIEAKGTAMADKFVENFMSKMNNLHKELSKLFTDVVGNLKPMASLMIPVGKEFMTAFMNGIMQVGNQIKNYVSTLVTYTAQAARNAQQNIETVSQAMKSGSTNPRAVGVDYVPYNGYYATLHEGEMVLTKEEAERYRKGLGVSGTGSGTDTFIFNSPKAIDEREAARLLKQTKRELKLGF